MDPTVTHDPPEGSSTITGRDGLGDGGNHLAQPDWLTALGLCVGTFLLYLPTLVNGFVGFDDPEYVTGNPVVKQGLTVAGIRWAFTTHRFANWLPITWLSHMADVSVWDLNAGGHHATSALLHAVNASLVFLLLRGLTGRRWHALAVAVLFAAHPLRVESVAWIAERKDVLSATFFLLTLLLYDHYVRRRSVVLYGVMLATYALGLMSKTMGVTLPFVMLLLDYWPLRRLAAGTREPPNSPVGILPAKPVRLIVEKLPLLAMAIAASAWTYFLQLQGHALAGQKTWTFGERLANAAVSVSRYLGKISWPSDLSVFYPHPESWSSWEVGSSVLLIVAITFAALITRRRKPYLLVGWLWFLGMLVPVSGIVQAGQQSMADRYTYLPAIGLVIAIVWAVADLMDREPTVRRLAGPALAVAVAALAMCTWVQESHWRSTGDLFDHALAVDDRNWLAHDMVGRTLSSKGEDAAAMEHFRRAIELNPRGAYFYIHLGSSLRRLGRGNEALPLFRKAAELAPDLAQTHLWLGIGLSTEKDFAGADAEFAQAVRLAPDDPDVYVGWGLSQASRGRRETALDLIGSALKIDPANPGANAAMNRLNGLAPTPPLR